MTLLSIVSRNLGRRPVRTAFTLLGIAIGIGAVVSLVGIARGFSKSWVDGMKARGTDIVVSNMASSLTPQSFDASAVQRLAGMPNIAATCSLYVDLTSVESAQMVLISARQWGGFSWGNLKMIDGRMPHDGTEKAVVLGRAAAKALGKKPGDPIQIETEQLTVAGIFDGNAWVENSSIVLSLSVFQDITGNQGKINVIDVRVSPPGSEQEVDSVCKKIDAAIPEARAMPAGENIGNSQAYRMVHAMSWGTSLLAVLVGVLGVMNTMLMTVFERTQEIAILLALGWRRGRIMRMILLESALLGFLGGVLGVAFGAIGVRILGGTDAIRGLLEPDLSPSLLAIAVAIALAVGVLSGLYPAWRSSRLSPARALQG